MDTPDQSICEQVDDFANGHLDKNAADAFRAHLLVCDACPGNLVLCNQIIARIQDLSDMPLPEGAAERTMAAIDKEIANGK